MKPTIFDYSDYRKFLKACYSFYKKTNKNFSHRYFSQKAGYSSVSQLCLVMNGYRNLSNDFIPKFANALGLNKKELQYFDALVSFNQAKTPESKRYYLELLHNLKKDKSGTPLSDDHYEYLSKWYYAVIREMVTLPYFEENAMWIRARLGNKVTPGQVDQAISLLLRLGLLKREESGRLAMAEADIVTEDEVTHSAAYSFHQQMLAVAREILSTTARDKRQVSGITVALSKRQFDEIKSKIREFENSIANYITHNPDVPDTVFQLNVHFLPVTNNGGSR